MISREIERRMAEAAESAKNSKSEFVTVEHILLSLTNSGATSEILNALGIDVPRLRKDLQKNIQTTGSFVTEEQIEILGGPQRWHPEFTLACHRWIQRAALQVRNAGKAEISEGHLLVALFFEQDSYAVYAMNQQGVTQFDVINFISHGAEGGFRDGAEGAIRNGADGTAAEDSALNENGVPELPPPGTIGPEEGEAPHRKQSRDAKESSALETYCVNLNEKARQGSVDPLIGREKVLDRIIHTLSRRMKNNPLLIGEPGVGKTAIIESLAQKIVNKEVPPSLQDATIFSMDMGTLLAGTRFRGDFENRLKAILKDIKAHKHAILFIDEIHTLVGAGATSGGSMDASNLLKPALASGELSCIGSTTFTEFRQHFEKDRALNRRFLKITVDEPNDVETLEILRGLRSKFEAFHGVSYTDEALKQAVELAKKHIQSRIMPDKAIDVIDEAGAALKIKMSLAAIRGDTSVTNVVGKREVEETVAQIAGIPSNHLTLDEKEQIKDLDKRMKSQVFGQDEAIDRVVASIKFSRSGLARENKPIGCFLFAGPTGVGKTEVAKQLASQNNLQLVRFDMSEYMEKHTVARLIGAPPGYVGFEEGGQLTEAINKNPHCVLLLDEMEKAHPDIFNVLLQVMDGGRLTDANGRTVDFKNVILVMTSNAGATDVARGSIGIVSAGSDQISSEILKKSFAPEFLNRLDAVVHFKNLDDSLLLKVVGKFVEELQVQLQKKHVELQVPREVQEWILNKDRNPAYGARPYARAVEEHLKKPLVDDLLFGRLTQSGKAIARMEGAGAKAKIAFEIISGSNPVSVAGSSSH